MNDNINNRVKALESLYIRYPLIVKARTDSGEEVVLKMRDFLERKNLRFEKILGGSDLEDLDLFLNRIREIAFQEGEGEL